MSKFHVGDKVTFVGGDGVPPKYDGQVASVIKQSDDGTYLLDFSVDDTWWANEGSLRPYPILAQTRPIMVDDLEMIADNRRDFPDWFTRAWIHEGTDYAVLKMFSFLARQILDLREQGVELELPAQPDVPYLDHN